MRDLILTEMCEHTSLNPDAAYEEVIARLCESFLRDIHLSDKAEQLYRTDKKAANKVLEFLRGIKEKLENWIKEKLSNGESIAPQSPVGKIGAEMVKANNRLLDLFIEGIRRASENLAYTQGGVSTRFEIREEAKADIKEILAGKKLRRNVILTENTPTIMLGREGVENLPLAMKESHIRENILSEGDAKAMGLRTGEDIHYHDLGEDLFYKVIDGLNDVTEAYRGTKNAENPQRRENNFLLISKFTDKNGETINVPIYINTTSKYNNVYIDTNSVATVYGKERIRDYINSQIRFGNLVRIKNRSTTASERTGLIPDDYSSNASTDSISDSSAKSNTSDEKTLNQDRFEEMLADETIGFDNTDPVTYDDAGKVIPLSARFDTEQKDIRYDDSRNIDAIYDEDGWLLYDTDEIKDVFARHYTTHAEAIGEVLKNTADIEIAPNTVKNILSRVIRDYSPAELDAKTLKELVARRIPLVIRRGM